MLSRPFENGHPIGGTPPTQLLNCPVPPAVLIAMTPLPSEAARLSALLSAIFVSSVFQ